MLVMFSFNWEIVGEKNVQFFEIKGKLSLGQKSAKNKERCEYLKGDFM